MTTAEEWKAKGNAALKEGKISDAIDSYGKAIAADGSNHVYYSNRSAAYLQQGNANMALEDAEACIGLNPDFAKGYSRKGAALHSLKRYNDSIAAYDQGLAKFPGDAGLKKGLASVKAEKDGPPPSMAGAGAGRKLFPPEALASMALDPKLRPYLQDEAFMKKVHLLNDNPNMLPTLVQQEPRLMEFLQAMMGTANEMEKEDDAPAPAPAAPPKPKESTPEPPQKPEEDLSHLSEEERKAKEAKERGNALYKEKKFDEALAAYDEARALDPTNMTFLSNQAAVYFTKKDYEKCIELCLEAVELGKQNRAPFEDRAKAYTRAARAYQKLKNLEQAIAMCHEAQLENYTKETQRLLKTMELEKKKADAAAYLDDDKAEEAKQRGNAHFRAQEWPQAVKEYEEAVKRSPKNAPIRNNLSAALCKIMDFNGAKREIEVAIELDPSYVKAWARKGDIEVIMKENHKAMDSYKKGLELDPSNAACKEGLRKVSSSINANETEEQRQERAQHAMADPEIQAILNDPMVRQVLQDFNENPQAAQRAMMDVGMRTKIEKLIASGIVQTA